MERLERVEWNKRRKVTMFLYPDLKTAIVGSFDSKNRLVRGYNAVLSGIKRIHGFPLPRARVVSWDVCLEYEQPNSRSLAGSMPLERDAFERKHCYVAR